MGKRLMGGKRIVGEGFPGLRDDDYVGDFPLSGKVTAE
jgi:hypothetical protein